MRRRRRVISTVAVGVELPWRVIQTDLVEGEGFYRQVVVIVYEETMLV